jgi:hypothetical protein
MLAVRLPYSRDPNSPQRNLSGFRKSTLFRFGFPAKKTMHKNRQAKTIRAHKTVTPSAPSYLLSICSALSSEKFAKSAIAPFFAANPRNPGKAREINESNPRRNREIPGSKARTTRAIPRIPGFIPGKTFTPVFYGASTDLNQDSTTRYTCYALLHVVTPKILLSILSHRQAPQLHTFHTFHKFHVSHSLSANAPLTPHPSTARPHPATHIRFTVAIIRIRDEKFTIRPLPQAHHHLQNSQESRRVSEGYRYFAGP